MARLSFNGHASTCVCTDCEKCRKEHHEEAKKYHSKPWAIGFNGHARNCECKPCTKMRLEAFKEYYADNTVPPLMPDKERTVFVRAHWRKNKNHLKHFPLFKKALIRQFL